MDRNHNVFFVVASVSALVTAAAGASTLNVIVDRPISRVVLELGISDVYPQGLGNWGIDNVIVVSGAETRTITFDELPPQSFDTLSVEGVRFRSDILDPGKVFTTSVFGYTPPDDTAFTEGPLLLADANTRIIMDPLPRADSLRFGLSFASGKPPREGLVGSVSLFDGVTSDGSLIPLGRFPIEATLAPGDPAEGLASAQIIAAIPVPSAIWMLLSSLGVMLGLRGREYSKYGG